MSTPGIQGFATMSESLASATHYHDWIFELLAPHLGKRIVECGTGCGILTRQLLRTNAERIWSLDISQECLDALADIKDARLSLERVDLNTGEIGKAFAQRAVDTVISVNVLEHLEDDAKHVERLAKLLDPGGSLLLFVPAFPALYGNMDLAAGHFRRYSRRSVRALAEGAGLDVACCEYCNPIGFLGWIFANKVLRVKGLNSRSVNAQIRLFDRWLVHLSKRLTPLTRNLFGQSVFVLAKRKGPAA